MERAGFDADFATFVRQWSPSLFVTVRALTGSTDEAEELLQDTFAALYSKWQLVSSADSSLAYVRRALINRFLSQRRRPRITAARWEAPPTEQEADLAEDVTARQWLDWLVTELPARQRATIVLRYRHDLSDAEIADHLGCRPATVRSLISRALKTLQTKAAADRATALSTEGDGQ
jgi:RNA polymerase sigma-70 factor (sigma-E family)